MTAAPLLAADVHYTGEGATAAGVLFADWPDAAPVASLTARVDRVAPYEPGAFYKRELPCLLALLDRLEQTPRAIVIDGYVTLGADARDGLGMHLWRALDRGVPVVGVAKTEFVGTPTEASLLRGQSSRPLRITAVGMDSQTAKSRIRAMHGNHRIPTLLSAVDSLARGRSSC